MHPCLNYQVIKTELLGVQQQIEDSQLPFRQRPAAGGEEAPEQGVGELAVEQPLVVGDDLFGERVAPLRDGRQGEGQETA